MSNADFWIVAVLCVLFLAVVAYLVYRWARNRQQQVVGGVAQPLQAGGGPGNNIPVQTTGVYRTPGRQF